MPTTITPAGEALIKLFAPVTPASEADCATKFKGCSAILHLMTTSLVSAHGLTLDSMEALVPAIEAIPGGDAPALEAKMAALEQTQVDQETVLNNMNEYSLLVNNWDLNAQSGQPTSIKQFPTMPIDVQTYMLSLPIAA